MLSLKSDTLVLPSVLRQMLTNAWIRQAERLSQPATCYPEPSGEKSFLQCVEQLYPHWAGEHLITNSATEALFLTLFTLKQRYDDELILAVRVPCFFAVLRQAELLGIKLVPFEHGAELKRKTFNAVLLTSNFTPPYGLSVPAEEREQLVELLDARSAWLIEDNPYDALWFDTAPLALEPERAVRIGSVSKILTPSFRLGFLVTRSECFKQLRSNKITLNLSTASELQSIAAETLNASYLDVLRNEWHHRAKVFHAALLSEGIVAHRPEGGSFVAFEADPRFIDKAARFGVLLDTTQHYYPDHRPRDYVRCHLGALAQDGLIEAASLLGKAYRAA